MWHRAGSSLAKTLPKLSDRRNSRIMADCRVPPLFQKFRHTKSSSCSTVLFLGLVTLVVILICRCIFYHFGSTLCHSSLLYYALIFSALFVLQLRTLYTCIFTYTHQTNAHSKKAYSSSLGMSFMTAEAIQRLSGITTQRLNCKTWTSQPKSLLCQKQTIFPESEAKSWL